MTKPSLRNQILDAGLKVMFRKGYIGSGVRDIVAEAHAPQGSFTNHFRSKEIFAQWRAPFAACIAEAQAAGEIATTFTADDLAEFLLASWEGAILRMKVERSAAPLERFKTIAFNTVFKEPWR